MALKMLSVVMGAKDPKAAASAIGGVSADGDVSVIDLCRLLVRGPVPITKAIAAASKIECPAESARYQIQGYFYKCLLGAKSPRDASWFLSVLSVTGTPYPQSPTLAPLMVSLGDLLLE